MHFTRSDLGISFSVPYKEAKTPPLSISPASIAGVSYSVETYILATSRSRRLISAGDPAPSATTTS